jgi:uncharacterized membrane protein
MSEIPPSVPPSYPPPSGGSAVPPPPPPAGGSSDRGVMLVLSYILFFGLIPIFVKKDDPEVQWHAKNGFSLFLVYFVIRIVWWAVVRFIFSTVIGCFTGPILIGISCLLWLGYIALMVLCIMKAVNGQRLRLPVISTFADRL